MGNKFQFGTMKEVLMDALVGHCAEWKKSDRERQTLYDITYTWNLKKKWYKWTYLQNRNIPTDIENKLMVTKGEVGGGIN